MGTDKWFQLLSGGGGSVIRHLNQLPYSVEELLYHARWTANQIGTFLNPFIRKCSSNDVISITNLDTAGSHNTTVL